MSSRSAALCGTTIFASFKNSSDSPVKTTINNKIRKGKRNIKREGEKGIERTVSCCAPLFISFCCFVEVDIQISPVVPAQPILMFVCELLEVRRINFTTMYATKNICSVVSLPIPKDFVVHFCDENEKNFL